MDFFLSRYRHLTVLLIVIAAQLLLIAYQVKTNKEVPLIRVWAVTAVTPVEQGLELVRRYTWGFVEDYFVLLGVRSQNEKLRQENGQLKIENNYYKNELATADRARALSVFEARSPSKTVAARVIGNGTGANSRVVFVDRGSTSGVESGMAVVTPDGIVGKVVDAYPTASLVMLITDPTFAAGVLSQKNRVHGTLKGQGHAECLVDYVQNEERVDVGEWFYTSGDDRIFPKGFPVGQVAAVQNGKTFKEIYVAPSAQPGSAEEVLIVLQGVHQEVPAGELAAPGYRILPLPADAASEVPQGAPQPGALSTDADRLRAIYKQAGADQKHVFGEGAPGSKPPDFTKIPSVHGLPPAGLPPSASAAQPSAVTPGNAAPPPVAKTAPQPNTQSGPPAEASEPADDEPAGTTRSQGPASPAQGPALPSPYAPRKAPPPPATTGTRPIAGPQGPAAPPPAPTNR
jgi:rod shape-determining protein MreC